MSRRAVQRPAMELRFERWYRVASYTAGPDGCLRPAALLGFLEDAAGEHAAAWHLSVGDLQPRGLLWVLTRYHLRLLRPPRYGEDLQVCTWPSARSARVALRDFEVRDAAGVVTALATTAWVVLDRRTRRLRGVDDVVPPGFVLDRRVIPDEFPPLPALPAAQREMTLPVMLRDLDMNRHVNHAVYLQWALEALPPELPDSGPPAHFEIAYLAEAGPGDAIVSSCAELTGQNAPRHFVHRITHARSGRELARLRTSWNGPPSLTETTTNISPP